MRQIENCYVKADALSSLAAFYEACAEVGPPFCIDILCWLQVEIDDFRDYEKGLAALNEALRRWIKNSEKENALAADGAEREEQVREKIKHIKRFIAAKQ